MQKKPEGQLDDEWTAFAKVLGRVLREACETSMDEKFNGFEEFIENRMAVQDKAIKVELAKVRKELKGGETTALTVFHVRKGSNHGKSCSVACERRDSASCL